MKKVYFSSLKILRILSSSRIMKKQIKDINSNKKRRVKSVLNLIDQKEFLKFKEDNPEIEISKDDYKNIIQSFNTRVFEEAVYKRDGVYLPEDLGHVYVSSKKYMGGKTSLNPVVLHRMNVKAKFNNLHTNNMMADIIYSNHDKQFRFAEKEFWEFKGCRKFTRSVSANFRKNWEMYVNLSVTPKTLKLRKLKDKINAHIKNDRETQISSEKYDEFNLD